MTILEHIIENNPDHEIVIADGFNDAIIGFDVNEIKVIYSIEKCINILKLDGMEDIDAMEYFLFNISGAYVGENTPIFCYDLW